MFDMYDLLFNWYVGLFVLLQGGLIIHHIRAYKNNKNINKAFDFTGFRWIKTELEGVPFTGEVLTNSYMDDVPVLIVRGRWDKEAYSYTFFAGEYAEAKHFSELTLHEQGHLRFPSDMSEAPVILAQETRVEIREEEVLAEMRDFVDIARSDYEQEGEYRYKKKEDGLEIEKVAYRWYELPYVYVIETFGEAGPIAGLMPLALTFYAYIMFHVTPSMVEADAIDLSTDAISLYYFIFVLIYMLVIRYVRKTGSVLLGGGLFSLFFFLHTAGTIYLLHHTIFYLYAQPYEKSITSNKVPYITQQLNENSGISMYEIEWFDIINGDSNTSVKKGYFAQENTFADKLLDNNSTKGSNTNDINATQTITLYGLRSFGNVKVGKVDYGSQTKKKSEPVVKHSYTKISLDANGSTQYHYKLSAYQCLFIEKQRHGEKVIYGGNFGLFNFRHSKDGSVFGSSSFFMRKELIKHFDEKVSVAISEAFDKLYENPKKYGHFSIDEIPRYVFSTQGDRLFYLDVTTTKEAGKEWISDIKVLSSKQASCQGISFLVGQTVKLPLVEVKMK